MVTGEHRVQRIYFELVATKGWVLVEDVVQTTYLCQTRHEYQNRTRIGCIGWVVETYSLQEADDEIIGDQPLIEDVDGSRCLRRVSFLKFDVLLNSIVIVVVSGWGFLDPVQPVFTTIELS